MTMKRSSQVKPSNGMSIALRTFAAAAVGTDQVGAVDDRTFAVAFVGYAHAVRGLFDVNEARVELRFRQGLAVEKIEDDRREAGVARGAGDMDTA